MCASEWPARSGLWPETSLRRPTNRRRGSGVQRMGNVREVRLFVTDLRTAGKGVEDDPIRRIIEFWTAEGQLVAAVDPVDDSGFYAAASSLLTANGGYPNG